MTEVEIQINGKGSIINLPESWQEVDDDKLPAFLEFVCRPAKTERQKITRLLTAYGFRKRHLNRVPLFMLNEIMLQLTWLNEPWEEYRSMLPKIGIFKGPNHGLQRLVLNQFIMAGLFCDEADNLQEDKAPAKKVRKQLEHMCGILYTPFGLPYKYERFFGLVKMHKLFRWYFRFVPTWKLAGASISWRAQRAWFANEYPRTHRQTNDGGDDHGPYGLIVALAGEKFGTVQQVHQQETRYVFTYLEQNAEQIENMKKNNR